MRQIFSVRFFAAVGAVAVLLLLLTTFFRASDAIDGEAAEPHPTHLVDFVDQVFGPTNPTFGVNADGEAASDTDLVIDAARRLRIVQGTPGEIHCEELDEVGACAVVADLLGEAVVWFALVPMGPGRTVSLPAIETLEEGTATLVNGWRVPFAPVLDRICRDEFESYRQFRDEFGARFSSVYDLEERRLTAVVCDTTVPYVTTPSTTAG